MSNHRASLLTGLRTGGPRSVSNGAFPQTTAQFPNFSTQYSTGFTHQPQGTQFATDSISMPMTAPAKEATFPQFQQQQALMLLQAQALQNAIMAGHAGVSHELQSSIASEQQAMHLQLEVYKMQAMHQQQLRAQLLHDAQRQMLYQHQQQLPRRRPAELVTAGPLMTSFGPQVRNRTLSNVNEGSATASLDGRFPMSKHGLNPLAHSFQSGGEANAALAGNAAVPLNWRNADRSHSSTPLDSPALAGHTGILSGKPPLGVSVALQAPPAKHAAAASWRRPSLAKFSDREPSLTPPPMVYVTTPEETGPVHLSESPPSHKIRPQPLRFNLPLTLPDQVEFDNESQILPVLRTHDAPSSPTTPSSTSSAHSAAREEATRRLYEGLGVGRPSQSAAGQGDHIRHASQPARQPRGPPSGVEELGSRNFATRIRRKAIGGLGALMDARGKRSSMIEVEAY